MIRGARRSIWRSASSPWATTVSRWCARRWAARCYQNSCFAASVAKAGTEDGHELFGHSIIVNPQGEITAQATSWDDELIVADCDLEMCRLGRETIFDFARHRRTEAYGRITAQTGSEAPSVWAPGERRRDAAE